MTGYSNPELLPLDQLRKVCEQVAANPGNHQLSALVLQAQVPLLLDHIATLESALAISQDDGDTTTALKMQREKILAQQERIAMLEADLRHARHEANWYLCRCLLEPSRDEARAARDYFYESDGTPRQGGRLLFGSDGWSAGSPVK